MLGGISVQGLDELRGALRTAGDAGLKKQLAAANKGAAEVVATAARSRVPVRSGALRGSIKALGSQASGRVKAGNARVAYAGAIHWGRKRGNVGSPPGNHPGRNAIKGRAFITDAVAGSEGRIVDQYEQSIAALVASIQGGH